jgi:aspartate aminotransferase-like enzyme
MLLIPGPTEISPRVIRSFQNPRLLHNDLEATKLVDETRSNLSKIFQTKNEVLILPTSGRGGIESALTSVAEPGDDVLVITNGFFGAWSEEIASRIGARVTRLDSTWGKNVDLTSISGALSRNPYKVVVMVHGETSTGVANNVRAVNDLVRDTGALFVVDAVSTMGGMDIPTDDWRIDLCITASQKCLGSVYGLAAVSVSDRAWARMVARKRPSTSYTLDLLRWKNLWIEKSFPKAYPVVLAPTLCAALHEATEEALEEGMTNRITRHRETAEFLRKGLVGLGMELFADQQYASDTTTVFNVPTGLGESQILEHLRTRDMVIGSGLGKLKGQVLRVGHMANTARIEYMDRLLRALEELPRAKVASSPVAQSG